MNVSYDTALKRLLKASADSLLTRITGRPVHVDRWVETELRRTEHRQADLLGLTVDGNPIHIELQSTNDPAMPLRMAEYAIGIYRQFQRLPFQLVLYFGYPKLSMQDRLSGPDPNRPDFLCQYALIDFRDFESGPLLVSRNIADNLLAVLGRFQDKAATIRTILERIEGLQESERPAAYDQLLLLSNLRRLAQNVREEAEKMPILDDIMDHEVYGPLIRKGQQEGRVEGRVEGQRLTVVSLITRRFGTIAPDLQLQIDQFSSRQLDDLAVSLLDAKRIEDLFPKA